jgi:hypothetical protein
MKLVLIFALSLPFVSQAAKLSSFAGDWRVTECFRHSDQGKFPTNGDGDVFITYIKETSSLLVNQQHVGFQSWPLQLDQINGKGIYERRKGECFDFKEDGIPFFKSCIIYEKIVDARLKGSKLTYRNFLKESWVRPFRTINGEFQTLEIASSRNKLHYSYFYQNHGSKKELLKSCELVRQTTDSL